MPKPLLLFFACAFAAMGVLIFAALVRDPIIMLASPQKVIAGGDVSILRQAPLRKNGFKYILQSPSGEITASGRLSPESKLIRHIEWPWESAKIAPSYSIINNIWLLSFLRLMGLLLISFLLACIAFELKKKRPNQALQHNASTGSVLRANERGRVGANERGRRTKGVGLQML